MSESDLVEECDATATSFSGRYTRVEKRDLYILQSRGTWEQTEGLEHEAKLLISNGCECSPSEAANINAV
jgi:hypothetical protein